MEIERVGLELDLTSVVKLVIADIGKDGRRLPRSRSTSFLLLTFHLSFHLSFSRDSQT
jgi:hypothetical protein